ncbi:dapk-1 [Symbiodinium sp. CCMP2592]|nr:dapk-1 [Symbiodinium sp. CCMP2592]
MLAPALGERAGSSQEAGLILGTLEGFHEMGDGFPSSCTKATQQYALQAFKSQAQEGTRRSEEETLDPDVSRFCQESIPEKKTTFDQILAELTESVSHREPGVPVEDELLDQIRKDDLQRVCMLLYYYKPKPHLANRPRGTSGGTTLMAAALSAKEEIAQALLAAGAPVEAEDDFGRTALFKAAASGDANMISIMLRAGANVDKQDNNGDTVMHMCSDGRVHGFQRILEERPNLALKTKGSEGYTALESAIMRNQLKCKSAMEGETWPFIKPGEPQPSSS